MALNNRKSRGEVLRNALKRLETQTPITATSPGSVARALTEAISNEIGDFYDLLDFNISQTLISTAAGNALDRIGALYNVSRKSLSEINVIDVTTNAFYFYLETPFHQSITIPAGTAIFTPGSNYIERQTRYETTRNVTILPGRRKVFTPIRATGTDSGTSVAPNTLTVHNFTSPEGASVRCTNPKPIVAVASFETDDNYRVRIINQLRVNQGGTANAVRFAILALDGVRDAQITSAKYGLGTLEMLVVPETQEAGLTLRSKIATAIEQVRPAGVRIYTKEPTYQSADLTIGIVAPSASDIESRDLISRIRLAVTLYLNSLLPGDTLVYSQLIQRILDASESVRDARLTNYSVGGEELSRTNYTPRYDEQVVPGEITVTILS